MTSSLKGPPKIHVVIRSFNEEVWIRSCLTTIFAQDYTNFFITLVDSGSSDATTRIAKEFEGVRVISTKDYRPGRAIMDGVRSNAEHCDFLYLVSAHCLLIGADVLTRYVETMQLSHEIAGIYGRQMPLHYTSPDDTRDLLNTFGEEFRLQKEDSFFHNANSFIRMQVLKEIPFDEEIKHLEDRIWAKAVIERGWQVAYLPTAAVYHYHGLHQHGGNISFRAAGVASILRQLQGAQHERTFEKIHMRSYLAPVVILTKRAKLDGEDKQKIRRTIEGIDRSQPIFLVINEDDDLISNEFPGVSILTRESIGSESADSFRNFAKLLLDAVEICLEKIVDALSFIDLSYQSVFLEYVSLARSLVFEQGRNGVVPAWEDFGNFWMNENGSFVELDVSFDNKGKKSAIYRSALGQGGCIRASAIRGQSNKFEIDEFLTTRNVEILRRHDID